MHSSEQGEIACLTRRKILTGVASTAGALMLMGAGEPIADVRTEAEKTRDRNLREDFANLGRYADDNARVVASGSHPSVVFMGDSITEGWQRLRPEFFGSQRICRGISGQTTPQMLIRMMPDVVELRPAAVHIMAGTNDIAGNTGPMSLKQSRDNIAAMAILARAQGLKVLIGSVPPSIAFRWRPEKRPAAQIIELNEMLAALSRQLGARWIDYHSALTTPDGGMRDGMARDGVHPVEAGYQVMEGIAAPYLTEIEEARG